jgi:hypothetical protein
MIALLLQAHDAPALRALHRGIREIRAPGTAKLDAIVPGIGVVGVQHAM